MGALFVAIFTTLGRVIGGLIGHEVFSNDATKPRVRRRIARDLKAHYEAITGMTNVTTDCTGLTPAEASCELTATTSDGATETATVIVSVDQSTGKLKIVTVDTD
jgi:hypothetical protein